MEDDAFEAGYYTRLGSFFLARFVEPAEVVAGLEDVVANFLHCMSLGIAQLQATDRTYCTVRPGTLLIQDLHQDVNRIGVLQNLQESRAHREVFHRLQHLHEVLRFQEFTCPK